jgi:hypothetical protein
MSNENCHLLVENNHLSESFDTDTLTSLLEVCLDKGDSPGEGA